MYFASILSFLRNGKLKKAEIANLDLDDLREEFQSYGIVSTFTSPQQIAIEEERERVAQTKRLEVAQQKLEAQAADLAIAEARILARASELKTEEEKHLQDISKLREEQQEVNNKIKEMEDMEIKHQEQQTERERECAIRKQHDMEWEQKIQKLQEEEKISEGRVKRCQDEERKWDEKRSAKEEEAENHLQQAKTWEAKQREMITNKIKEMESMEVHYQEKQKQREIEALKQVKAKEQQIDALQKSFDRLNSVVTKFISNIDTWVQPSSLLHSLSPLFFYNVILLICR